MWTRNYLKEYVLLSDQKKLDYFFTEITGIYYVYNVIYIIILVICMYMHANMTVYNLYGIPTGYFSVYDRIG